MPSPRPRPADEPPADDSAEVAPERDWRSKVEYHRDDGSVIHGAAAADEFDRARLRYNRRRHQAARMLAALPRPTSDHRHRRAPAERGEHRRGSRRVSGARSPPADDDPHEDVSAASSRPTEAAV